MRFKLDENLPTQLADLLNSAGHDAMMAVDEGRSVLGHRAFAESCFR